MCNAFFDLLPTPRQLGCGEVAVAIIDRFELAAVNGNAASREQGHLPAEQDETATNLADRITIISPEIGNRFVIGYKPAHHPDRGSLLRADKGSRLHAD